MSQPDAVRLRVAYAGTPEFAAVALQAILAAGFEVPLVLTQPDRPAGRGLKLQASPVKLLAHQQGVPVVQPLSLRLDGRYPEDARVAQTALMAAAPDVLVVAAYGLILPRWVLDLPRLGCLNIHASLLPRWRGAAPIHRAIEAGDGQTGVTIMQMEEGLDTGPMCLVESLGIAPGETTAQLHDRLASLGAALIVQALRALQQGGAAALPARPQPAEGVCYAHKIEKAEAALDWSQSAQALARRAAAFDPFPGANFRWAGDVIKVWAARAVPGAGVPGTVLAADAQALVIACGEQALAITQLQRPGGKRQAVREFLAACPLSVGAVLPAA
jgi:methionyl-tRNA formyltransferase